MVQALILFGVQVPVPVQNNIYGRLSFSAQAAFRAVCRSWRDAYPAYELTHRVIVQHQAGWERAAYSIKQTCPNATLVLVSDCLQDLPNLLANPLCDIVSCSSQPDTADSWQLALRRTMPDRAVDLLRVLRTAECLLQNPFNKRRLNLRLTMRSSHTKVKEVNSAIASVKDALYELRVVESLAQCAASIFPLSQLRVLAFKLPLMPGPGFQAAIVCLPCLQYLQVFADTANATSGIPLFLKVLRSLPQVSSLKICTQAHCVSLSAETLQYVTYLQLGSGVTMDEAPDRLQHLRLEALHRDLLGILPVFRELEQSGKHIDCTLDTFTVAALMLLPANLQSLTLLEPLEQSTSDIRQMSDCRLALDRLKQLKCLVIADFMSSYVGYVLKGLVFSHAHTLGFCLTLHAYSSVTVQGCTECRVFSPCNPRPLNVFPNLQNVRVYGPTGGLVQPAIVHCGWLDKSVFTKLCCVICYCSPAIVQLCDVPHACNIIFKPTECPGHSCMQ